MPLNRQRLPDKGYRSKLYINQPMNVYLPEYTIP